MEAFKGFMQPMDNKMAQDKMEEDLNEMLQEIGKQNALLLISFNPDHQLMIEMNEGLGRIYQSWIRAFTTDWWMDINRKLFGSKSPDICPDLQVRYETMEESKRNAAFAPLEAARNQFGGGREIPFDTIKYILNGTMTQMKVKWDGSTLSRNGVRDMVPYFGKPPVSSDDRYLQGVFTVKAGHPGIQLTIEYLIIPGKFDKVYRSLQEMLQQKPAEVVKDAYAPSLSMGVSGVQANDVPASNPINQDKLVAPTPQDLPQNYKMKDKMPNRAEQTGN